MPTICLPLQIIAVELGKLLLDFQADIAKCDAPEDEALPVRLQVLADGTWRIHWGDAGWDTDHRGAWASAYLPGYGAEDCRALAKALILEAGDDAPEDFPTIEYK